MPSLDLAGALLQLAGSLGDLPLAHPLDVPHQEPPKSGGGGASPVLVGGGIAGTLALAGGLIWVRQRALRTDDSAGLEGHAHAEGHEQAAGPTVEPGDHAGPGEEPA
ncbi:MAG TPA: hypothetical protein VF715_19455 [Thermoleophilaceae bacterium]